MNRYTHTEVIRNSGLNRYMEGYLNSMLSIGRSTHTHRRHQSALRSFIFWCEDNELHDLHDVSKETLKDYRNFLYAYRQPNGQALKKGSLNSKLTPLKKFIQWCAKEQLIYDDFACDLEIPKKPRGIPTKILMHDSIEHILQQPNINTKEGLRDRAILEVLYSTAIRRSEVSYLKCQDIDPIRKMVKINNSKNGQDRFVPISERALNWVTQYLKAVRPVLVKHFDDNTLFLSREGIQFQPGTLAARVKNHIKRAKIDTRGSCHLFRHSVATQMLENGADIRYIQALLGHVNLNTTEIYTRVTIKKLREVHRKTHPTTMNS